MKNSTAMAALLGLLLALFSTSCANRQMEARLKEARQEGLEQGKTEGRELGYEEGVAAGKMLGWRKGYEVGYEQGKQTDRREGFQLGYGTGYEQGERSGRREGFQSGHETGYSAGLAVNELIRSAFIWLLATYTGLALLAGLALWFRSKGRRIAG